MTKTGLGSELVHGPGASSQVLGMPLGRHALSVECLKPWTVAAEHSVKMDCGQRCFPRQTTIVGLCLTGLSHIPDSGRGFATGKTRAKR